MQQSTDIRTKNKGVNEAFRTFALNCAEWKTPVLCWVNWLFLFIYLVQPNRAAHNLTTQTGISWSEKETYWAQIWPGEMRVDPGQRRADSPQHSHSNGALEVVAGTDRDWGHCRLGNPLKLSCPTFTSRCFLVQSGSVDWISLNGLCCFLA